MILEGKEMGFSAGAEMNVRKWVVDENEDDGWKRKEFRTEMRNQVNLCVGDSRGLCCPRRRR